MSESLPPEQLRDLRAKFYNATLAKLTRLNPELAVFTVQPDRPLPPHRAGQYLTLGLGTWEPRVEGAPCDLSLQGDLTKMIRRAYSMSHPILDEAGKLVVDRHGAIDFYIVLLKKTDTGAPAGLTPRLFMLKEGDRLHAGEKVAGHYTLADVKPTDTVLFLATGTGEAPHTYMTWELLKNGHQGPIISVSCVRVRQDLGYLATCEKLAKLYPQFHYVPLTTREPGAGGQKVYIQQLLENDELERRTGVRLEPAACHVYLCGNPKMIGVPIVDRAAGTKTYPQPVGCVELLERQGFKADLHALKQRGNIHFEEYW